MDSLSLWPRARACTRAALASGALRPLSTRTLVLQDGGIPFVVRIADGLIHKEGAGRSRRDPFLPPFDPDLVVVAELPPAHRVLLNKFPVLPDHLLVVTGPQLEQEGALELGDFVALWRVLQGTRTVAFYNGGTLGGASQPHRHMQVVPLPLGPGADLPLDAVMRHPPTGVGQVCRVPFPHAVVALPPDLDGAGGPLALWSRYRALLQAIGRPVGPHGRTGGYNLLVSARWMLAVPRSTDCFEGISTNALGFAGSLMVHDEGEAERLARVGPIKVLQALCG